MPSPKTSTGLDENLVGALAYLLGLVSGVILLLIEPDNRYVRFHAFQSTFTFLAVAMLFIVLMGLGVIGWILWVPCFVGVTALWVFLMFKALNGVQYKLPLLGDWAEAQIK
jgi:uncharacterized membrane protein